MQNFANAKTVQKCGLKSGSVDNRLLIKGFLFVLLMTLRIQLSCGTNENPTLATSFRSHSHRQAARPARGRARQGEGGHPVPKGRAGLRKDTSCFFALWDKAEASNATLRVEARFICNWQGDVWAGTGFCTTSGQCVVCGASVSTNLETETA